MASPLVMLQSYCITVGFGYSVSASPRPWWGGYWVPAGGSDSRSLPDLVSRLTARAAPSSIIYVAVQQYSIVRSDAYGASPPAVLSHRGATATASRPPAAEHCSTLLRLQYLRANVPTDPSPTRLHPLGPGGDSPLLPIQLPAPGSAGPPQPRQRPAPPATQFGAQTTVSTRPSAEMLKTTAAQEDRPPLTEPQQRRDRPAAAA